MNKDEILLRKRLIELSNQAYTRDIVTFSDFLNLNELNILHTTPKDMFPARYETYGGYESSERQMVSFLPDALYFEYTYPIQAVEIAPLNSKFAEDLTHRDFLGSLMNLGIERSKMGDVLIQDNKAIVFSREEISSYISENLSRIRHTMVKTRILDIADIKYEPRFQEIKGNVASIRLDSVLSVAFPMSRSKMTAFIDNGRVFVNGKLITSNGYHLKENDIISVRGLGRIRFIEVLSETRKGRYMISVYKYI